MEMRLERPGEHRTIFSLLDLLILEGIYPSLSPHVGIPIERRARSFVIPRHMMTAQTPRTRVEEVNQNIKLLGKVIEGLVGVLSPEAQDAVNQSAPKDLKAPRGYKGIEGMVRERSLVDLIAGCGELAYNPELTTSDQAVWRAKFGNLVDGLVHVVVLVITAVMLMHLCQHPNWRAPASIAVTFTSYGPTMVSTTYRQISITAPGFAASWC
jgi:hypothetical protein